MFFREEGLYIRCTLCPQSCLIGPDHSGLCGTRRNIDNKLYAIGYGVVMAMHLDPVEKKPLRHFMPGSKTFSIGFAGCNLFCPYCQNSMLSRATPKGKSLTPESILRFALSQNAPSISYTYSEPLVQFEFVRDTAMLAHKAGLKNILVSNGYINPTPLELFFHPDHPLMDAVNFDIKSSRPDAFQKTCRGKLEVVWNTVETVAGRTHMEVTALMVPGLCDVSDVLEIAKRLSPLDVPLHISRYFPRGSGPHNETRDEDLQTACRAARLYLSHVHLGNV